MMWTALQADGSRIPIDEWVLCLWKQGQLTDPVLTKSLDSAVEIYPERWL